MGKYLAYPESKVSGAQWFPRVPKGWDVLPARRVFIQVRDPSSPVDEQLAATQKYGVIPQRLFMEYEDQKVVLALTGTGNFKHVETDDFVISLRSFQGGIERCHYSGCVSPAYTVMRRAMAIEPAYFSYLLKSEGFISELRSVTQGIREGKNVSYEQFGAINLPFPSMGEQQDIAIFLDHETAKIDRLIARQERLIDLLKEKRQAVISHAVTKGLNPDAPMKDSGVEWLGEVPSHWKTMRLKYLGTSVIGLTYSPTVVVDEADGTLVLRASNIKGGKVVSADDVYVKGEIPPKLFTRPGDILLCSRSGSRDLIGKNSIIDENSSGVAFGAFMMVFRGKYNSYLAHVFNSPLFDYQSSAFQTSTINQLTVAALSNMEVPMPPADERDAIASYINAQAAKLDLVVEKATRSIDLMKEHRTALVSAAVTGKIDVRDWQKSNTELQEAASAASA